MNIHSEKRAYIPPESFKELYYNYMDFLEYKAVVGRLSERRAKELLKEEIINMICLNGVSELFESELAIARKIGLDINQF